MGVLVLPTGTLHITVPKLYIGVTSWFCVVAIKQYYSRGENLGIFFRTGIVIPPRFKKILERHKPSVGVVTREREIERRRRIGNEETDRNR